jgi:type II secretory pathway pseudopilin PulG
MRRLRAPRPAAVGSEAGLTLIELLIAAAMSIVLLAAVTTLLVGALRAEPRISEGAATVQKARWVLERMTRELRQGFRVYGSPSASTFSFGTYVRDETCGGTTPLPSGAQSTECEVTYECATSSCTRLEAPLGVDSGSPATIFSGLSNGGAVFSYSPSATSPTFVEVTLTMPNPDGGAALTVSDGAALRGLGLDN